MLEDMREKLRTAYLEKVKGECIFCKLIEDDHEKIIFQNEEIAVFPPLKSGALKEAHLLVVPKNHARDIFELEPDRAKSYFSELKNLVDTLKEKSRYKGVNLLSANGKAAQQSIQHFHTHLVLREKEDGFNLWPKTSYSGRDFAEVNNELENLLD